MQYFAAAESSPNFTMSSSNLCRQKFVKISRWILCVFRPQEPRDANRSSAALACFFGNRRDLRVNFPSPKPNSPKHSDNKRKVPPTPRQGPANAPPSSHLQNRVKNNLSKYTFLFWVGVILPRWAISLNPISLSHPTTQNYIFYT